MIAIGGTQITKAYLGSTELANIAIGDELLLSREPLPYDAEVGYLGFTGTQYINTGILASQSTKIEIDVLWSGSSTQALAGARNYTTKNSKAFCMYMLNTPAVQFTFGATAYNATGINTSERYVFTLDHRRAYIDGTLVNTFSTSTFSTSDTILVGSVHTGADGTDVESRMFVGNVYSIKVLSGSELQREYIPVRLGQVGYFYDKVSKTLFGNAGTSDFILGNDVI